jgi:hypothetical protein
LGMGVGLEPHSLWRYHLHFPFFYFVQTFECRALFSGRIEKINNDMEILST